MNYVRQLNDIRLKDAVSVGGKNASLGEMISQLHACNVRLPEGFALTTDAYWYVLDSNKLRTTIQDSLDQLPPLFTMAQLHECGTQIRTRIMQAKIPDDLAIQITDAYDALSQRYQIQACDVAVRSSATAEDLPGASFAGQQESYLNIKGHQELLRAVIACMASLFTDRAIAYRRQQGFTDNKIALSVGIQKMIRSDKASAGVAFSIDTETGYRDAIIINGAYGLGELVVKGDIIPDEFIVHKPTLEKGFAPIIRKQLGDKSKRMIYSDDPHTPTTITQTSQEMRTSFCLTDDEILELAGSVLIIEQHYSKLKKTWSPMDIEWAKDGIDGLLYIVQARPETVHARTAPTTHTYQITAKNPVIITTGQSIGQRIASGPVRVIRDPKNMGEVRVGEIIVSSMTDPDWVPVMKRAAGIITTQGSRTCHAAIVSRELGIPAIVGVTDAFERLKTAEVVTIDCSTGSTGYVYQGAVAFTTHIVEPPTVDNLPVKLLVNCGDPDRAFTISKLPVSGVGLARLEFIIAQTIGIHPMACVHLDQVTDPDTKKRILAKTVPYDKPSTFFVETLAQGIARIAAGFYPRKVVVRLSDFKTDEYRNLLGGCFFEPIEEKNPMLGFRGALRYYDQHFKDAFALECAALHAARNRMGLMNIAIMVPFVRTTQEAARVCEEMARHHLKRGEQGLEILMMCEIPSNVLLIEEFSALFDGFSIGSNDLTQLTLGVDRDSDRIGALCDERDPAVKKMIAMAIAGAHAAGKPIGICGQAPSDYAEFADFLITLGIDSLSLNPDAIIPFLMRYAKR